MVASRTVFAAILAAALSGCATSHTSSREGLPTAPVAVEVVARVPTMPGNIAVSRNNRIFLSQHPFGNPTFRVVELNRDGTQTPFPTPQWSSAPEPGSDVGISGIIGIEVDQRDRLWMLDIGSATSPPKLVAWDLNRNTLAQRVDLASVWNVQSFMQDLAIDLTRNHAYIADIGGIDPNAAQTPAIVVVNLATGATRRVLESHPALKAEDLDMLIEGKPVQIKRDDGSIFRPRVGINPITIDAKDQYVYFGSMTGTAIYRVRAELLADAAQSPDALGSSVELWGTKGISDGFNIDQAGNVYVTDLTTNSIRVALAGEPKSGGYVPLTESSPSLSWADGVSFGGDGMLYATVNQLHRSAALNAGTDETKPPFTIVRLRPNGTALLGR